MRRVRGRALVAATLLLVWAPAALATIRVMRILDWRSGLPVSFVGGVEQDPEGFLWVTTSGGLFRYDGAEMVRMWEGPYGLVPGSASAGTFLRYSGTLGSESGVEMSWPDGTILRGPGGRDVRPLVVRVTPDRAVWAVERDGVLRRSPDGTWSGPFPLPAGEAPTS